MVTKFVSDSLCVLLTEPNCSSISTSVLFNHALSVANAKSCSTIVRSDRLTSIPLRFLDAPENPPISVIRRIEFVYLNDRYELMDYIGRLYDSVGTPASFVIDSLEKYSASSLLGKSAWMALLNDLGSWMNEKRKTTRSKLDLSPVLASMTVDRSEHEQVINVIRRYTSNIWILRSIEDDGHFEMQRSNEDPIRLKITNDNRIIRVTD